MKIQAFIPDWPSNGKTHASDIVNIIRDYCPVTILNDPSDFFNHQWEKARAQFTGDVLLWWMADVSLPASFGQLYGRALETLGRSDIAWYAPDIAWTSYIYDQKDLNQVAPDIYEVPNTDSLFMFIRGDLVRAMPYIDPKISFMWGMDIIAIATARLMGLKVVRDYRFKAEHPNDTGYSIPAAGAGMSPLFDTLMPELREECAKVEADVRRLRRGPCAIF